MLFLVKKNRVLFIAYFLLVKFFPSQVHAETIFYCETMNGKQVEVQIVGDLVQYRFGDKLYKPEMELVIPREETYTFQWLGAGVSEYYDVTIPNNSIFYKVFISRERTPKGKFESGIGVWSKDTLITKIYCRKDSLYEALYDVRLPRE
ncbi:hypothetical protein [Vibrio sp. TRT 17S01]|uniref:hypothetical protein n=1 Tax=Vibrio sp. TRT 17S01 TaxID=3418505 RepID=UPI003CEE524E